MLSWFVYLFMIAAFRDSNLSQNAIQVKWVDNAVEVRDKSYSGIPQNFEIDLFAQVSEPFDSCLVTNGFPHQEVFIKVQSAKTGETYNVLYFNKEWTDMSRKALTNYIPLTIK